MKILKFVGPILIILVIIAYIQFPRFYSDDVQYWTPGWWHKCLFNFCKYQIPKDYEAIDYMEGGPKNPNDKYIVILKNKITEQYLIISKLRGFYFIPSQKISVGSKDFKQTNRFARSKIFPDFDIVVYQAYLPSLEWFNISKIPNNLILKGMVVNKKEEYETSKAKVLYLQGEFTKLGFFKKMPFLQHFPTPVFDFLTPQKGAVAIVNNKEKNETVMVVSTVTADKTYDENNVKELISSLTFDKEPFVPYWPKGAKPKTTIKYKLQ